MRSINQGRAQPGGWGSFELTLSWDTFPATEEIMRLFQSVHARRASGWLLIASVALFGATCVQAQTAAKPPASKQAKSSAATVGVEVQVTDEMRGAGEVSSGVKLPPSPPVTGDRKNPVPSWG